MTSTDTSDSYNFGNKLRSFILGFLNKPIKTVTPVEPILALDQIQGNLAVGFNKPFQRFLAFNVVEGSLFKTNLTTMISEITSAQEVLKFRKRLREFKINPKSLVLPSDTWVNIAFTCKGLKNLNVSTGKFKDKSFSDGFRKKYLSYGDGLFSDGWEFGVDESDVLFIVAGDFEQDVDEKVSDIIELFSKCTDVAFLFKGQYFEGNDRGKEHFGFKDGINQPSIRGRVKSEFSTSFLTKRNGDKKLDEDENGEDMIWPGEFIFGYPGQSENNYLEPGPTVNGGENWADDGSYLVFLKFRQDYAKFTEFLSMAVEQIKNRYPSLSSFSEEQLAFKLMGRTFEGVPVANNDAPFLANPLMHRVEGREVDQKGLSCPFSAHTRKTFPKNDLRKEQLYRHRILRRGVPFGEFKSEDIDKGLLFLCYQTSIQNQFERIFFDWMNNPAFLKRGVGREFIAGSSIVNGDANNTFSFPYEDNAGIIHEVRLDVPNNLVRLQGGEYYFSPSIKFLSAIAK